MLRILRVYNVKKNNALFIFAQTIPDLSARMSPPMNFILWLLLLISYLSHCYAVSQSHQGILQLKCKSMTIISHP